MATLYIHRLATIKQNVWTSIWHDLLELVHNHPDNIKIKQASLQAKWSYPTGKLLTNHSSSACIYWDSPFPLEGGIAEIL